MRFFFDLADGGLEPDCMGTELESEAMAQREAIRFVGEVLKNEPHRLAEGQMRVDVRNERNQDRFAVVCSLVRS